MPNACTKDYYFSGQGAVLLATRDILGSPEGFRPVGNVSALTISVETTVFEHKESCTGVRGIDLKLTQEIKATTSMTMESLIKENLALALYGQSNVIAGGSATDESHISYLEMWTGLENISISSVVITDASSTTTYTEGTDYQVNYASGSIQPFASGTMIEGDVMLVSYDYVTQDEVQAITTSVAPEVWARFEGLNTADQNKPVVIDMYKMSVDPLAELALINEEITEMVVESTLLSDSLRATGSNYFTIRKIL